MHNSTGNSNSTEELSSAGYSNRAQCPKSTEDLESKKIYMIRRFLNYLGLADGSNGLPAENSQLTTNDNSQLTTNDNLGTADGSNTIYTEEECKGPAR